MSVFWFWASTCFPFGQKLTRNVAQIQSHGKSISFLLELIDNVRFQNTFWKSNSCFQFWWKTYTKLPALCGWSSALISRIWPRRMPCKQKYWIKNVAVKIPILILFCFCLLCWLSPISIVVVSCCNYIGPNRWI